MRWVDAMVTDRFTAVVASGRWFVLVVFSLAVLMAAGCGDGGGDGASPRPTAQAPIGAPTPGGVAIPTGAPDDTSDPTSDSTPDATSDSAADGVLRVGLEEVASGLTAPVYLDAPEDGSGRLFVVELTGRIRVIDSDGEMLEEPFLDLSDRIITPSPNWDERGLLGMAFHPDFAETGRFFVYYSAPLRERGPEGWNHTSHVSEFRLSEVDANVADPDSERLVMQIDQPQFSHNAGHLRFGPDGYLYIPLGDGGGGSDVGDGHTPDLGNAQDTSNWLGSVLRIDVDREGEDGLAYAVPDDNPFVGQDGYLPEIWAYGLRNPYDISFDPAGEYHLFIADAGEVLYEWVNHATGGENFGWNIREGAACFNTENARNEPEECPETGARGEPLVDPVVEYARADYGTVVVGAQIYRGQGVSELEGLLVVADWSLGRGQEPGGGLLIAQPGEPGTTWEHWPLPIVSDMAGELAGTVARHITALGRDADGEVYVVTNEAAGSEEGAGAVYRLVSASDVMGEVE